MTYLYSVPMDVGTVPVFSGESNVPANLPQGSFGQLKSITADTQSSHRYVLVAPVVDAQGQLIGNPGLTPDNIDLALGSSVSFDEAALVRAVPGQLQMFLGHPVPSDSLPGAGITVTIMLPVTADFGDGVETLAIPVILWLALLLFIAFMATIVNDFHARYTAATEAENARLERENINNAMIKMAEIDTTFGDNGSVFVDVNDDGTADLQNTRYKNGDILTTPLTPGGIEALGSATPVITVEGSVQPEDLITTPEGFGFDPLLVGVAVAGTVLIGLGVWFGVIQPSLEAGEPEPPGPIEQAPPTRTGFLETPRPTIRERLEGVKESVLT